MNGDPFSFNQRHIFNEQSHHALAFKGFNSVVMPNLWEVLG
jgi:hypothetical protein